MGSRVRHRKRNRGFLRRHSLSIAAIATLLVWIVLYIYADPKTHWGSFFGNAIADWTGVVVTVVATKYLYEMGSTESNQPHDHSRGPVVTWLRDHSLTLFLIVTGIGWILLYRRLDSEAKWGEVVGNIVSEWTQLLGLVLLTKKLIEDKSKESK